MAGHAQPRSRGNTECTRAKQAVLPQVVIIFSPLPLTRWLKVNKEHAVHLVMQLESLTEWCEALYCNRVTHLAQDDLG